MSLEPIPENWMDLLENDDTVQKWHRETDNGTLPTDSVESLISYIEYYYKNSTKMCWKIIYYLSVMAYGSQIPVKK